MTSVQHICHPHDRCQLGDLHIILPVDHSLGIRLIIILKRHLDKFHYVGDQFPFCMGKTDDLRRHDDLISALRRIAGTDKIAAVV